MNPYGRILRADLLDGAGAAAIIRAALSALYAQGRFLGGFRWADGPRVYRDEVTGDVGSFLGTETIILGGPVAYRLDDHGGLIRP
jgi:hypothetical protein